VQSTAATLKGDKLLKKKLELTARPVLIQFLCLTPLASRGLEHRIMINCSNVKNLLFKQGASKRKGGNCGRRRISVPLKGLCLPSRGGIAGDL